jgi:hypothetical protein
VTNFRDRRQEAVSRFYGQGQVEVVGPSFSRASTSPPPVSTHTSRGSACAPPTSTTRTRSCADTVDCRSADRAGLGRVTQRIIGKEARTEREPNVRALPERGPVRPLPAKPGEHKFTPLSASLRFNPYQSTTVDATAQFGNVSHQLDQLSLSANLIGTGKLADKYLGFTYFARLEDPDLPGLDSSQIRINAGSFLIKERLRADVQLNYDAKKGEFLEHRYLMGWTGSCYGIALEYRRYRVFGSLTDDESLSSYGIAVTLKNVGTIGSN